MLNTRLDLLNDYPFQRLNDLLAGVAPRANQPPVVMSVGEPQHQPPAFVRELVDQGGANTWNRYPPLNGTPEFRAACADWLTRRYKLKPGSLDADAQITPVAGTREGLFQAALLAVPPGTAQANGAAPVALMPNPFYQVYFGAAVMAGAQPVFMAATRDTGFLPDLDALDEATLARTAIMYLCSPANPQGVVADLAYLKKALSLARQYNFLLVSDECYAELYLGDTPPPGGLEAAAALGGGFSNLIVFHTLSKRSSAPGLRSGFAVGAPETIARLNRLRAYSCAATPLALLDASAALWRDEAHVEANRALYRAKYDLADRLLGGRFGYYRPASGFYLWLDVGDGEAATRRLWSEAGIKVLPGGYITKPDATGKNHGKPYIRVALVHDLETTEAALTRMASVLEAVA
jgi:N-succinyldiaminopimelate aminotransferase